MTKMKDDSITIRKKEPVLVTMVFPYASAGLIWKHFGGDVIYALLNEFGIDIAAHEFENLYQKFDKDIIELIDMNEIDTEKIFGGRLNHQFF